MRTKSADRKRRSKSSELDGMKLRPPKKPELSTHAPIPVRTEATIYQPKVDETSSLKITLMQLGARQCRWATHETVKDGHMFCGRPTRFAKSYCDRHEERSQQKTYKEMKFEEERKKAPKMLMVKGPV